MRLRTLALLISMVLPGCLNVAGGTDIPGLKALVAAGQKDAVGVQTVFEGIVVSDCASLNMALNPNTSFDKVDVTLSRRTAYVQTPDGKAGIRLVFKEVSDNTLQRYDHVKVDLQGTVLEHCADPDCITAYDLVAGNVLERKAGSAADIQPKVKKIAQLTDEDLFTFVTLSDVDFVCKQGTYANIYEGYAQMSDINTGDYRKLMPSNQRMDGWATLLRDTDGSTMYMMVNTLCTWRKTHTSLPSGLGNVSGIVVSEVNRRYGGNMGRYGLRPLDENDIAVSRKRNTSPWKMLTAWIIDDSMGQALEFELLGVQEGVWKNGKKGDKVVNDQGSTKGLFWTDSDSFVHIGNDLTANDGDSNGYDKNGCIVFKGPTVSWYTFDAAGNVNGTRAAYVQFSAKKAKGTQMQFNFAWFVGDQNANNDWGYPAEWKVECSIDGGAWTLLKETATGADKVCLRSLPWWDRGIDNLGNRQTSLDCGLGSQIRSYAIPAAAFGAGNVIMRLSPASDQIAKPHTNPAQSIVGGAPIKQGMTYLSSQIYFGHVSIDYK